MRPYYVQMLLPGETSEEFALILPFTPQERQNMVAWMAARCDPENYGEILSYEFPAGRNVDGPVQVFNQVQSYPPFSEQATLLGTGGSRLLFGNLLVIPIDNSFLYVQPVFVQSSQENAYPELKRVVVVQGGTVGIGSTLGEALISAGIGPNGQPLPGEQPSTGGTGSKAVDQLLAEALAHFQKANQAL